MTNTLCPDLVYTGDARQILRQIADRTVDLIITDPPYLREYLPVYSWLSAEAARVLKPGSFAFVYGSTEHLPDHLARLSEHLDYYWLFTLRHRRQPRIWYKRLMSDYKPVMVYSAGKARGDTPWMRTAHEDEQEKGLHEWQQGTGFVKKMIEKLTEPGALILDPFCGSGAFAAAAKELDRRYITIEIDREAARIARRRLATINPLPMQHYRPPDHLAPQMSLIPAPETVDANSR